MIETVTVAELSGMNEVFKGSQLEMVRAAIVAGNTAGRLWRLAQNDSQSSFLWDQGNNVFYLGGDPLLEAGADQLAGLIAGEIQQQAIAEGARYFRARGLTAALHAQVASLFTAINLEALEERFYGYPGDQEPAARPPARDGVVIRSIDRALLSGESQNLDQVISEIVWMWPGSREEAAERFATHGFGSVATIDTRIVCWCTAEYVGADRCGIGIETVEEYQRQGIATATAAHFIGTALDRGIQPFWECYSGNLPSVRLADRLGFKLLESASFWAGVFPSRP